MGNDAMQVLGITLSAWGERVGTGLEKCGGVASTRLLGRARRIRGEAYAAREGVGWLLHSPFPGSTQGVMKSWVFSSSKASSVIVILEKRSIKVPSRNRLWQAGTHPHTQGFWGPDCGYIWAQ